ncbi:MAG TPA: hypothetical protein VL549_11605 [Gemmatimonadales bacterium]|nr:hypothetical protein [Gemmatimonadales bacterium]
MVAIAAAARRRVLQAFREVGATAPARAQPVREFDRMAQRQLRHLIANGLVRETNPGLYYLDEVALYAWERRQRRIAAAIGVALIIIAGVMTFVASRSR